MHSLAAGTLTAWSREELLRLSGIFDAFFEAEAPYVAETCHEVSRRFLAGGRLVAFGSGADAQHVSVEFVRLVVAGKRSLPAA